VLLPPAATGGDSAPEPEFPPAPLVPSQVVPSGRREASLLDSEPPSQAESKVQARTRRQSEPSSDRPTWVPGAYEQADAASPDNVPSSYDALPPIDALPPFDDGDSRPTLPSPPPGAASLPGESRDARDTIPDLFIDDEP
jgi:hypothetical protein